MKTFDLEGMRCPMPIVQLNRIVSDLADGDEFAVTANDPAFAFDLPAWCRRTGHELVSNQSDSGNTQAVVRVRHSSPCANDQ